MPMATASPWATACAVSRLEPVRGPVTEVERARAAELERVAAARDLVHVQLGAATHEARERVTLEARERRRVTLELGEDAASRISATLTASAMRRDARVRAAASSKARSLSTANGGAKVPR